MYQIVHYTYVGTEKVVDWSFGEFMPQAIAAQKLLHYEDSLQLNHLWLADETGKLMSDQDFFSMPCMEVPA